MWMTLLKTSGIEYSLLLSSPHIQSTFSLREGEDWLCLVVLQICICQPEQFTLHVQPYSMLGVVLHHVQVLTSHNISCGYAQLQHLVWGRGDCPLTFLVDRGLWFRSQSCCRASGYCTSNEEIFYFFSF